MMVLIISKIKINYLYRITISKLAKKKSVSYPAILTLYLLPHFAIRMG